MSTPDAVYYARLGSRDTAERPKGLLRRIPGGPEPRDEVLRRDGRWHPTDVLSRAERGDLFDELVEIPAGQAEQIARRWRAMTGESDRELAAQGRGELGLRLARPVDEERDAQGRPVFTGERLDGFERVPIGLYLTNAPVAAVAPGFDVDPFDPSEPGVVPLSVHTDGLWVWFESLAYLATTYGMPPEPGFLAHIRRRRYRYPEVDEGVLYRAAELALGSPSSGPERSAQYDGARRRDDGARRRDDGA